MGQDDGASLRDRAVVNGAASVSAVPASIPSAVARCLTRTKPIRMVGRMGTHQRRHAIRKLYVAQGGKCGICGRPMGGTKGITADHVFPRYFGLLNVGNMVAAHKACNQQKGRGLPNGCNLIWLQVANTCLRPTDYGHTYVFLAQGMETGTAKTEGLGPKDDSPVGTMRPESGQGIQP